MTWKQQLPVSYGISLRRYGLIRKMVCTNGEHVGFSIKHAKTLVGLLTGIHSSFILHLYSAEIRSMQLLGHRARQTDHGENMIIGQV